MREITIALQIFKKTLTQKKMLAFYMSSESTGLIPIRLKSPSLGDQNIDQPPLQGTNDLKS